MDSSQTLTTVDATAQPPRAAGYGVFLRAAFGHAVLQTLRRRRLLLVAGIAFLPILIPLSMAFLLPASLGVDGLEIFSSMAKTLQINALAPLLALFLATMLLAEDFESRTIVYVATRPMPRSAWVLGRFFAYLLISTCILALSLTLMFGASAPLPGLDIDQTSTWLLAGYVPVLFFGLAAAGALAAFLGTTFKRPIIVGVIVFYGWQKIAMILPGSINYLTLRKYTDRLLPLLPGKAKIGAAFQSAREAAAEQHLQDAYAAAITLTVITVVFLAAAVVAIRLRNYGGARAAGS